MKNKLKGIIFFTKKIKDNDLYIKILSSNDEIDSGMVYGGNSSKKKFIYQKGYFVDYYLIKKNQKAPPVFTADISYPFLNDIFNDKYKLYAMLSILDLINISILEGQKIRGFFNGIYNLINKIINTNNWMKYYCEWLFYLLKIIGYQIDYKNNESKKYFNLNNQEFSCQKNNNAIEFPHELFSKNYKLTFKNINLVFNIFENILLKNHLDNLRYKMPINFINFKKVVLERLNH